MIPSNKIALLLILQNYFFKGFDSFYNIKMAGLDDIKFIQNQWNNNSVRFIIAKEWVT